MNKKINFCKMQAAGNDFIIIDNRTKWVKVSYSLLAKKLCSRKFSIGADGFLALENSKKVDFKMVYFNSDGSPAEMCGNGARCISYYAFINNIAEQKMRFETNTGVIKANISSGARVKIGLPEPKNIKLDFDLKVGNREFEACHINTGVPHTVIFVTDINKVDVQQLGQKIRNHSMFSPRGTNADFVKVIDKNSIVIRTYERGVEAETLACGTGAVASAVISGMKNLVESPVKCRTASGEILKVYFKLAGKDDLISPVYDVYLEGKVSVTFTGTTTI